MTKKNYPQISMPETHQRFHICNEGGVCLSCTLPLYGLVTVLPYNQSTRVALHRLVKELALSERWISVLYPLNLFFRRNLPASQRFLIRLGCAPVYLVGIGRIELPLSNGPFVINNNFVNNHFPLSPYIILLLL